MSFNRKQFALSIFLLLIVILNACQPNPTPSPLSAALSELKGKVELKQAGQDAFTPATANSSLEENGQVQTGDDGRVRLDLSTGTIIRVAPSSLFTLVSNEPAGSGLNTKLDLVLGRVYIILNGGSLEVQTPSGTAAVRGSYLMVEVDPDTLDVYVTCLEGDCSAGNEAGSVNFSDGQKSILFHKDPVTGEYSVPGVDPMTPEDFQQWLDDNPEARDLFNKAVATMTAMTAEPPTQEPTTGPSTGGTGSGGTNGCFKLLEPPGDSGLPVSGAVNFEWDAQPGAAKYVLTFTHPNGTTYSFETTQTNLERYIESLPDAGSYQWNVTAYDENGQEICQTEPFTFIKPSSHPEDNPPPHKRDDRDNDEPMPTEPPYCDPCDPGGDCFDPYNEGCYSQSVQLNAPFLKALAASLFGLPQ